MKNIKKIFTITLLSLAASILPWQGLMMASAQAAPAPPTPITSASELRGLLCNIISWFIIFVLVISIIMVVVSAFDYVTAGDDTEKTTRARRRLTYAAVGIAVVLIAYGFPQIIANVFPSSLNISAFVCGSGSSAPSGSGSGSSGLIST